MQVRIKYVVSDTDRHGNLRVYYRRPGQPKIRLRGPVGSPEFFSDYHKAAAGELKPAKPKAAPAEGPKKSSFRWLCSRYYDSPAFRQLDPNTRRAWRGVLERFCANKGDGDKPYADMRPRHIRARRDDMMDRPGAANNMVKVLRVLFRFAINYDLADANPAAQVEYLRTNAEGIHSWTLAEIEQFEAHHPIGTKARLAFALALYTSQRRSDIVQFGRQHVRAADGVNWLIFTQHKGRNRHPVRLEIPVIAPLQQIIDASETGDLTFLVTAHGKPFTSAGFGNWFRERCNEAGLRECSVHGLRKAAASRLAELGCTEHEIMAITGHTTSKEVTRYTKGASQRARAQSAFAKMAGGTVPPSEGNGGKWDDSPL